MLETETKEKTIRIPKIRQGYWNCLMLGSSLAVGLSLVDELSFKQMVGTFLIVNVISFSIGLVAMSIADDC